MPELPEVELVACSLDKLISRRKIIAGELLRSRLAPDTEPSTFAHQLNNAVINYVTRRGKHILFDLGNGRTLITHLRMSGRFMLLPTHTENPKFTHAIFYLNDDTRLVFQDQRHFGLMKIVETQNLFDSKELKKLAPEPLSEEFSLTYFRNILKSSKRPIKEFLIDQTKVCGLGNIYAAEALFLAKINPEQVANRITSRKSARLYEAIREVLVKAIILGRKMEIDSTNISGSIYGLGSETGWRVYGRENLPCPNCSAPIARLKQAGRSTYFCPKCQRSRTTC
ncbi:MAG: bifunctional DNA-formamidopyrimidine glycosylase/DNA-(apurinic or apyrimidinic site) lyase [Pyrinomonadaceae bacterium]|nr:bifunctional DNA-formamidopyrimidine glycosylase/DNA-(apurinic or apyrimidinic site) lyase [Blastocatellia bacterium]MDQ3220287.1 bifunctional DNA-formamidopyrimidine glycosylase/DNA-(apurinic or apyrimidinic site) lyase [Acidobacteriota bacterium]